MSLNSYNLLSRKAARQERNARAARLVAARAATQAIVATGWCPDCGSGLRRNLALPGWWQCQQFGAEGFRKDSTKPACTWQGFTE